MKCVCGLWSDVQGSCKALTASRMFKKTVCCREACSSAAVAPAILHAYHESTLGSRPVLCNAAAQRNATSCVRAQGVNESDEEGEGLGCLGDEY